MNPGLRRLAGYWGMVLRVGLIYKTGVGPDWQARSSIPGSGLSSVPKVVERVLLSWIGARKPTSSRAGDAETKKLVRAEGVEPSWTF